MRMARRRLERSEGWTRCVHPRDIGNDGYRVPASQSGGE